MREREQQKYAKMHAKWLIINLYIMVGDFFFISLRVRLVRNFKYFTNLGSNYKTM